MAKLTGICIACANERDTTVKAIKARGLCGRHYDRAHDHGTLDAYPLVRTVQVRELPAPPVGPLEALIPIPPGTPKWRGAWESEKWNKAVQYEVERGRQWLAARQLAA